MATPIQSSSLNTKDSAKVLVDASPISNEIHSEILSPILKLLHDPKFTSFEIGLETPNFFNVVGRTFTETWHSRVLGWLFDPKGSHGLSDYPIKLLFMLLANLDDLDVKERGVDLEQVLVKANFAETMVQPSENLQQEFSFEGKRFDVFITKIVPKENLSFDHWKEINLLIETKVNARIDKPQCFRYIAYTQKKCEDNILIIPLFIAPTEQFPEETVDSEKLLGNKAWIRADYRQIYLQIIEPCLQHKMLSDFGRNTLSEYIKALRSPRNMKAKPLIITKQDRKLVDELFKDHTLAISTLLSILNDEGDGDSSEIKNGGSSKPPIKIKIGSTMFEASSVRKLYEKVLKFLYDENKLQHLELPMRSGPKQNLLVKIEGDETAKHPAGNPFWTEAHYKDYYMEATKSHVTAITDLKKVLEKCGLKLEVLS